ncbi:MAG: DUF1801 domain-containing protein [Gammaproteobacteria bacterium]|nr:DUF1801 domain-containing protein [Gammaproteobacteria bacterium]NNL99293.1 DUF1801 domain-containing protein [Gammaproteobacteria bacterium]
MHSDVERYFAALPEARRPLLDQLHALITGLFPAAEISMQYKMPTYRVGEGWVAIANQKRYVSLYTCGAHHLAEFKARHPDVPAGKGCLNFRPAEALPLSDLKQVIRHAIEHPKPG